MASTGSILAARAAGMIPEIMPIAALTPRPNMTFLRVKTNSKLPNDARDRRKTKNSPAAPPKTLRNTDSNKNWNKTK